MAEPWDDDWTSEYSSFGADDIIMEEIEFKEIPPAERRRADPKTMPWPEGEPKPWEKHLNPPKDKEQTPPEENGEPRAEAT